MTKNTEWKRVDMGPGWRIPRGYTAYSRIMDGELIFTVRPDGDTPGAGEGGYYSVTSALQAKGFNQR